MTARRGQLILLAALALASGCDSASTSLAEDTPLSVKRVLSQGGPNPGEVIYPRAIDSDDAGIWLVDKAGTVQHLDAKTGDPTHRFTLARIDQGKPTGLTVAPLPGDTSRDALWVPETHNFRVLVFDPRDMTSTEQPEPVATFGSYGEGDAQFIYLTDVAVSSTADGIDRIYASEYGGNDRVSVFDAGFNFLFSFGEFGVATPERAGEIVFNRPQAVEIDTEANEVVVADACNHRLGRFTPEGELIAWIGSPELDMFRYPYGIRILKGRQALVAEFGGNRLSLVDLGSGTIIRRLGVPGRDKGELASPWGVATIGNEAFILDSANNRVQVIRSPAPGQNRYPARERTGGSS